MNPPPKILTAEISDAELRVKFDSGCNLTMPLERVPTLLLATQKERREMEIFDHSLHWESLDCDLSVEGLMAGAKEMPRLARKASEKNFARQCKHLTAQ